MGTISLEHSDQLYWLGRYTERVYTTLKLFSRSYDIMIDTDIEHYIEFCEKLDIPNIYTSSDDFSERYCFDKNDVNSIFSNLTRAYDNAIVLREEIGSETLSYIQLAIYDMEKSKKSKAPLIELQRVLDDIMAFWGMVNEQTESRNARNLIKTGKRVERLSMYSRLNIRGEAIVREANRLKSRIEQTKLPYSEEHLNNLLLLVNDDNSEYRKLVYEVENLI